MGINGSRTTAVGVPDFASPNRLAGAPAASGAAVGLVAGAPGTVGVAVGFVAGAPGAVGAAVGLVAGAPVGGAASDAESTPVGACRLPPSCGKTTTMK